ncbi:MAG: class I SAM-dependent methyltransferase [Bryobacteraceae bacterium]
MRLRRTVPCSCLVAATLFATAAAAQNTQPRREPDVPFVPTTEEAVAAMLKLADVKKSDIVYDLGCGDGRIVIAAAKIYGAHAVGIDINPVRLAEANENLKKAGPEVAKLVRFEENDLFQADIHEATVVTLFLLSSVNLKLRPKLLADLKPGTRVVSNTFDMGDWKPEKEFTVGNPDEESYLSHHLFLWIIPARK